ncbi:TetR/AcrR family transcriptional regulator [Nocardia bovistercoris]|uniref:TetR/AcrR family transcriptional regulator n=1 Tax=Nocardia bovistercoris TaxID=2785916 RepID=A0A931N339_9NOCA|nr:TetR/AcrR family transcriptional regulator [Nocardia bovistercoris]
MPKKSTPDETAGNNGGPKSERTRQRVLDAAARVLSRKGYAGTRLADVADEAELQAPAIYYYYSSREELIEEVMWTGLAHMADHLEQTLDEIPAETTALERIESAVEAHLRFELSVSDYTAAAIRNAGQIPEQIRARYDQEATRYGDIWRKLFQDALEEGYLRPELDAGAARMLVLGALNWAAEWWNPRRGSLEKTISTAKTIVRHGLSPDPDQVPTVPPRSRTRRTARATARKQTGVTTDTRSA